MKSALRLGQTAPPASGGAGLLASLTLPSIYSSDEHLLESRRRYEEALNRAMETPLHAADLFNGLEKHETFHLAYQGLSVKATLEKHGQWLDRIAKQALPQLTQPIEAKRKPGRFRLGYVSANLSNSNGARWALGWLENHAKDIEAYSFYLGEAFDVGTRQFKELSDHFFQVVGSVQGAAEFIRSLDLDALIYPDLGMNGKNYQFAVLRLARLQCTAWGHPVTSGLPTIDCYLSSDLMEPSDAQEEYAEKLVRLPGTGLCYRKIHEFVSARSRPQFGLTDEPFLLMGQNLSKWTPRHDPLLKKITDRTGKPIVFLGNDPRFRARMERAGVSHVMLPEVTAFEYDRLLQLADVSIDPPDWSGGNTTIRALALGTPVVTLPGQFMRGRHSFAFLKRAGMEGLIAKNEEDFVDLVLSRERRHEAMKSGSAEALYEDKAAVRTLDEMLLSYQFLMLDA